MSLPTATEVGLPDYRHGSRESWLQAGIRELVPWFDEAGVTIPENIQVTTGFGPTGSRTESTRIMGGTLHTRCSTDGSIEIFISPESPGPMDMLATLVHELIHAVLLKTGDRAWWGHTGEFSRLAGELGLVGPMASSEPGPELLAELESIAQALGAFPGSPVVVSGTGPAPETQERRSTGPKPQTGSRYLLAKCTENPDNDCYGYQTRVTRKWADFGLPRCPRGHLLQLTT